MRLSKKRWFTYREWFFTTAEENLFHLSREELFLYRLIIKGSR